MPRARNTQLRESILRSAYRHFLDEDFDAIKVKDIADDCGISTSLLQHYFPRKADMLQAIGGSFAMMCSDFVTKHFRNELLKSGKGIYFLQLGLFYHIFGWALIADNNRFIKVFRPTFDSVSELRKSIDFAVANSAPHTVVSEEYATDLYLIHPIISGCIVQFIPLYLSGYSGKSFAEYIDIALDLGFTAMKVNEKRRKELLREVHELLTPEVRDEFYIYMQTSLDSIHG